MQTVKGNSWHARAVYFPKKTAISLKKHWMECLNSSLDTSPWRKDELVKLGELAKTVFDEKRRIFYWNRIKSDFPNRSLNSIKNIWYSNFKTEREKLLKIKNLDEKKRTFEEMEGSIEKHSCPSYFFTDCGIDPEEYFDVIDLPEKLSETDLNFFNP